MGLTIPFSLILVAGTGLIFSFVAYYSDFYWNIAVVLLIIGSLGLLTAIIVWIVLSVKARKVLEEPLKARRKLEGLKKGGISLLVIGLIMHAFILLYMAVGGRVDPSILWIFLGVGIPLSLIGVGLLFHSVRKLKKE